MKTTVRIFVYDSASGAAINGANVSFKGQSSISGGDGYATFYNVELSSSSWVCTASKEPIYSPKSEYFTVNTEEPEFAIGLGALTYDIFFTIMDEANKPIQDVTVQLNSTKRYTNYLGETMFGSFQPQFSFTWQAYKDGYQSQNGSGVVGNDNVYINLIMIRNKCLVTYNVTNSAGQAVSGVTVSDNVSSGVTGSNGQVQWYVPCSASYSWTATSQDYFKETGSYSVGATETSKTVNIVMKGDGALLEVSVSSGNIVTLPVLNTASSGMNNLRVSWGDGEQTLGNRSHTYSTGGTYRILFDFNGNSATLQWSAKSAGNSFQPYLLRVMKWFTSKINTSWSSGAFQDCSKLTSVPSWTASLMSGTADYFFDGCSALKSVPNGILTFSKTYSHTYADSGLSGSINLNYVLGGSNVTSYVSCFYRAKNLSSVTGSLSCATGGCDISYMFYASSLSSISFQIGANNIKTCAYMFNSTPNLSTPCQISFLNGTSVDATGFAGASGITTLQANTFIGSPTTVNFTSAFGNSTLSTVSSGAFSVNPTGSDWTNAFMLCSSLLDISNITIKNALDCTRAFNSSGVTSIPGSFFSQSNSCFKFESCFQNCKNLRTIGTNILGLDSVAQSVAYMFDGCTSLNTNFLATFIFAASVTKISENQYSLTRGMFKYCTDYRYMLRNTACEMPLCVQTPGNTTAIGVPLIWGVSGGMNPFMGIPSYSTVNGTGMYNGMSNLNPLMKAAIQTSYPSWIEY